MDENKIKDQIIKCEFCGFTFQKCDGISGTLTVIQTKEGWIFGGYTSVTWDTDSEDEKKDIDSLCEATSFENVHKAWDIFKNNFLQAELFAVKSNKNCVFDKSCF